MKKHIIVLISLVFLVSLFESCTVEKRIHQRGYHIAWNKSIRGKHVPVRTEELAQESKVSNEITPTEPTDIKEVFASNSDELILDHSINAKEISRQDTVVPGKSGGNEEYFNRNANERTPNTYSGELPGREEANLSLGFGIAAITSPIWVLILVALLGAASAFSLEAVVMAMVVGFLVFIVMTIAAVVMGAHFLKRYGKDPAYAKYKQRAVTGIVLASIIPGLILMSLILAIAMA